jgi:ketosteroid isomerase-like protein
MAGWQVILKSARPGTVKIEVSDVRTAVSAGQAFVTCLELLDSQDNRGRIVATNVFERQDGQWKIIHHHGSPMSFAP